MALRAPSEFGIQRGVGTPHSTPSRTRQLADIDMRPRRSARVGRGSRLNPPGVQRGPAARQYRLVRPGVGILVDATTGRLRVGWGRARIRTAARKSIEPGLGRARTSW